ncbi:MAG: ParB/RepB/Spo0J family partition protein [Gammaproteobacteria bacterium]|nr:ParB/RepB/Spo0J family partition protein [Gammaproteobacteria bacterium]
MNAAKRGLGRGLDALLAGREAPEPLEGRLKQVPIDLIRRNSDQPRRHFGEDDLAALADSIREQGVLEPVLLRPAGEGNYEIVAGERRWRAAQQAGLTQIPALIRDVDDSQARAVALVENMQRVDLRPLEQAEGLHQLMSEHSLTQQAVSETVGLSRAKVANLLRLRALEPEVKSLLDAEQLSEGHAKVLLGLSEGLQIRAAKEAAMSALSVRQTETLVNRLRKSETEDLDQREDANKDADTRILERELGERLGAKVSIRTGKRGKGRLVIQYSSLDILDGILRRIRTGS